MDKSFLQLPPDNEKYKKSCIDIDTQQKENVVSKMVEYAHVFEHSYVG